jgi:DMSO/TMAO reductase YedYZ molybdopterin-dependent catalytic subunit
MLRRQMLAGVGGTAAWLWAARLADANSLQLDEALPLGTREEAELAALPGKQKLIKLTWRPPNFETPQAMFDTAITPNDRFFVRYHLADIPEMATLLDWSLTIGGDAAERPYTLTLDQLRAEFEPVEIAAVCLCSGNRRGFSDPHVPGVQWGVGAMGNAVWRGARLRDVLARAGVKAGALELWLAGADGPVLPATPAFRKSLPIAKALEDAPIIAYAMNGEALPRFNGFPARLIVPGWTATYWMKHIRELQISTTPIQSFWMKPAYRVPAGMFPVTMPFASQTDDKTTPITEIVVNSLITRPAEGAEVPSAGFAAQGVAWDRGAGIRSVEVSLDEGKTWRAAQLGNDLGRFSFREWRYQVPKGQAGPVTIMARATSASGETQAEKLRFNPAGYHNNVPRHIQVNAI